MSCQCLSNKLLTDPQLKQRQPMVVRKSDNSIYSKYIAIAKSELLELEYVFGQIESKSLDNNTCLFINHMGTTK